MDILERLKGLAAYRFVGAKTIAGAIDEIARLRAEAEANRVDAERYRWLRDESWSGARISDSSPKVFTLDGAGNRRLVLAECALDAAIDAARGKDNG
jgi:hypothetical protein